MKRFSTIGNTERFTEVHEEEERERRETEMSKRRKRGTHEERDRSMQFSVPKVFAVAQTPTEIHRIGLGREGGGRK